MAVLLAVTAVLVVWAHRLTIEIEAIEARDNDDRTA